MWTAYILYSPSREAYYKGSSGNMPQRIVDHNRGHVRSTKAGRPWRVHCQEQFDTKAEALAREKYFKSASGYRWLKTKGIM